MGCIDSEGSVMGDNGYKQQRSIGNNWGNPEESEISCMQKYCSLKGG
jgi:hypothetical protein